LIISSLFSFSVCFNSSNKSTKIKCDSTQDCDDFADFEYETETTCNNHDEVCDSNSISSACDWHSRNCECFPGSHWDTKKKLCMLKAGSSCKNSFDSIQTCTLNSICNEQNLCECVIPYYENSEGHCVLKYGFTCSASEDTCDISQFMECNTNPLTYGCKNSQNSTYYDAESSSCKIKADNPCNPSIPQLCTERAVCLRTEIFQGRTYEHGAYM